MSLHVYLMPPLPLKADLFQQLLTGHHRVELFVGATGEPIFAIVLGAQQFGAQEARLVQDLLEFVVQRRPGGAQTVVDAALVRSLQPIQTVFTLQSGLLVDLARYEVLRGEERIPLRSREAELLRILLRQPRCYVSADVLAEAIGAEGSEEIEHPVEEMISNIRRKLGETPHHPKLIRCKRYAGYAIFPEEQSV